MKRNWIAYVLVLSIIFSLPFHVFATQTEQNEDIIYLDDGSYIIVELTVMESRASGTKSGSRTYTYYASNDEVEWKAVLNGTFSYTGTSATCTHSSCSVTIADTVWYEISRTSAKSGATAIGEVTMGRKFLGIKIDEESVRIEITCDKNGNLS